MNSQPKLAATISFLALAMSQNAFADEAVYRSADGSYSVTGGVGLMNIDAGEYVYDSNYKISELDWKARNVTIFSLKGEGEIAEGWKLRSALKVGMGGDSAMTDRDWLYNNNNGPNGADDWTDKSEHPGTELDHYWSGSIEIGKDYAIGEGTTVGLGMGVQYTDVQWTASGGSYVYSAAGFRDRTGNFQDSPGITYRQKVPVGYLALNLSQSLGGLTLSGSLKGGATAGISDIDNHWRRRLKFEDTVGIAPFAGADVNLAYAFSDAATVFVGGSYERVFEARGDMKATDTVTRASGLFKDSAGTTFEAASVSAGMSIRF